MDQQKLRSLVFEKTGVKIDVDDPVFAVVALNEAVLAEAVERHVAMIDRASEAMAARLGVPGAAVTTPAASAASPRATNPLVLAGGAAVLAAALVLLGEALWFKPAPAPAPAPVSAPPALTEQQAAALRQADKLDKIVQKLDPKTRNTIRAELAKP